MSAGGALILTAELPADLHRWATRLRQRYFPPERNFLEAHVTLFHALPPSCEAEARTDLARLAGSTAAPAARLSAIMDLGSGTAFAIESAALMELRDELSTLFHGLLNAQDSGRPRLHITIQNKVAKPEARALQAHLRAEFEPRHFAFRALALHVYRGGPWETLGQWPFRG